jgi:hypothetical protein
MSPLRREMRLTLLAAFALAACATAPKVGGPNLIAAAEYPSTFDFGGLRFEAPARFEALQREVEAEFARLDAEEVRLRTIPAAERPSQCAPDLSAKIAVRAWMNLAAAVPDQATWDRDATMLRDRIRDIVRASFSWRHGAGAVDRRARSAHLDEYVRELETADDTRVRELFQRVLSDQTLRYGLGLEANNMLWTEGLSPEATAAWRALLGSMIVDIDCFNAAWLRAQLAEIEWFDSRSFGPAADRAAWLLSQHADLNTALQVDVLSRLERLAPEGGTNASNFAYLWDRVAVSEGRPQRFGTQIECVDGAHQPTGGLEDAARVEERRSALRMQSYVSYLAMMAQLSPCPAARASSR